MKETPESEDGSPPSQIVSFLPGIPHFHFIKSVEPVRFPPRGMALQLVPENLRLPSDPARARRRGSNDGALLLPTVRRRLRPGVKPVRVLLAPLLPLLLQPAHRNAAHPVGASRSC